MHSSSTRDARSHAAGLTHWQWLPLVLLFLALTVLYAFSTHQPHDAPMFRFAMQLVVLACAACLIGFVAGRDFLAKGASATLLLGCGALAFGLAGVLANVFALTRPNEMVTIHNLCIWISAMLHFLSASTRQSPPVRQRRLWLLVAYAATVGTVCTVAAAAANGLTPPFFVQGAGGTPVRQIVLGSAVLLFIASAWLLGQPWVGHGPTQRATPGRRWYAHGLLLVALGLAGVWLQKASYSTLSWVAMVAQWTGSAYLVVAALQGAASSGPAQTWPVSRPLQAWQDWTLAAVAVAAAAVVRLVFFEQLGMQWPYLLMYPAVLAAALYGGWVMALFAGVLALLVTNGLWVDTLDSLLPRDAWNLLPSLVFAVVATAMVAASTWLQRARHRHLEVGHARTLADQRRAANEQLRLTELRYRALFDSVDQGVSLCELVCDAAGRPVDYRFLDVNPAFSVMTGLVGQIVGRTARELVPGLEDHWVQMYGRVVLGGEPMRFELPSNAMGRYFDVFASPTSPTSPKGQFVILFTDITHRKRAEERQRERAALDAFRVALSDLLRPLSDPADVLQRACKLLAERLDVQRVHYAEVVGDAFVTVHQHCRAVPAIQGHFFVELYRSTLSGPDADPATMVVNDVANSTLTPALQAGYAAAQVQALIGVPVSKAGVLLAGFGVHHATPRAWTPHEVALAEEAAERIWDALQRARAESALARVAHRNRFALDLATALRPLSDPVAIRALAASMLGAELNVQRVNYFELEGSDYVVHGGHAVGVSSVIGRHPVASFGQALLATYTAGKTVVCADVATDAQLSAKERSAYAALSIAAYAGVPLVKDGSLVAGLTMGSMEPRVFEHGEIDLLELTAEQTWSAVERARSEQAVQRSERVFRTLGEALPALLWMAAADGAPVYQNPAWQVYTGLSQTDLMEQGWLSMNHPDDRARLSATWDAAMREPASFAMEHRMRRHDGTYRWFHSRTEPVFDESGELLRWVGVASDIHERKLHTEQLAAAVAREQTRADELATLMRVIPVPVWVSRDPDCRVVTGNDASYALMRAPSGSNMSMSPPVGADSPDFRCLHDGVELSVQDMPMQRCASSGWPEPAQEIEIVWADGHRLTMLCNAVPLHDADGRQCGVISVGVDLTERKRIERELQEADRRKDEFLALLGHELRNPLAPVRTAVQAIALVSPAHADVRWACNIIERQMQQMSRLIDDLLDVSRITQGLLTLQMQPVELRNVVHAAIETSRPTIEQLGHELAVQLPTEPVRIQGDAARLAQVLSNLLNNAARYSDSGGRVALRAVIDDSFSDAAVLITVSDTGIGIAPAKLGQVFEPFEQLDRTAERSRSGLGIGLTLVKRLVELHGGTVQARSEGEGRGSEFTVRLPRLSRLEHAEHTAPRPASDTDLPLSAAAGALPRADLPQSSEPDRLRILIVDDNRDATDTLHMLLALMGHNVRTARDGAEALRVVADFMPAVVLLDLGMPVMDGYEAARRLRQLEAERDEPRPAVLIATTGWGLPEDRERTRQAGFDHHLVKPLDPKVLFQLLPSALARA